jgi:hypothetical protein
LLPNNSTLSKTISTVTALDAAGKTLTNDWEQKTKHAASKSIIPLCWIWKKYTEKN